MAIDDLSKADWCQKDPELVFVVTLGLKGILKRLVSHPRCRLLALRVLKLKSTDLHPASMP